MHVVHPFDPVMAPKSRILILGSFPSVQSRENLFYYGHPRNRFWPMLAKICGTETPETIEKKQQLIKQYGLALWDVIGSCDIEGSSDASIRNAVAVDISQVLNGTEIKAVICNGKTAGRLYEQYLEKKTGIAAKILPSTSPANAAWTMEKLIRVWSEAFREYGFSADLS